MTHLSLAGKNNISSQGVLCVALIHNELAILPEFLHHYRSLGITSFAMVDDRSTDDTRQFLLSQDDVTVFTPTEDSTYRLHKRMWRKEILDAFASERWALIADIDEHFIYPGIETKPLAKLVDELDEEDSRALITIMIDMYQDRPILEQRHDKSEWTLLQAFPYFGAPHSRLNNYYFMQSSPDWPTPPISVHGGFRSRMLTNHDSWWKAARRSATRQCYWGIQSKVNKRPCYRQRRKHPLLHNLLHILRAKTSLPSVHISKLGLIKWQHGLQFFGGAHTVNKPIRCSERIAAFLHYYFAHGIDRFHYIIKRASHYNNSADYIEFLRSTKDFNRSPICELSTRYLNSQSLKGLIR